MNQIYLVMESNGENYEDYQEWPVGYTTSEQDAKAQMSKLQEEYNKAQAIAQLEEDEYNSEYDSLISAIPYNWTEDATKYWEVRGSVEEYLTAKYPNANHADYEQHLFFISGPVPLLT